MADYIVAGPEVIKYLKLYADKNVEEHMGSDGYLIDAYQNGDGLHLNEDGFRLVLDYQRTHGWN